MARRQPKPEPFSLAELEEIAQSPALQGFEKVLQYRPVLVEPPSSTVVDGPSSTVVDYSPSTVDDSSATTVVDSFTAHTFGQTLWVAENGAGVFTSSRIRRILRAQDALTHIEEAVYDALWGTKKDPEPCRLVQIGYAELAKRSRVSKRGIQRVTDRLLEKHFIEVEKPADISTRQPTTYKVFGYSSVLKFLRETGRLHVVRTGKGVFYAHKVDQPTVDDSSSSTVDGSPASTVDVRASSTVDAGSPSTVDASSTVNTLGKNL